MRALNAFLDNWHHAAAVADEAAYFDALDSTAIYLGTDPGERWTKQSFHEWAKPEFAKGSAWDLTPFDRHITLGPGGDIAWFDEKIKWFDNKKGYGFITVDGKEDIFVHYSQIEGTGFKTLRDGESVECDVVQGTKGLYAEKVRRLEPTA